MRAKRLVALLKLVVLFAGLSALCWAALRVPAPSVAWGDLNHWLEQTPPEDALLAVIRLAAIAGTVIVVTVSALYALAVAGRFPHAAHRLGPFTMPAIRRAIDVALGDC